MSFDRPYLDRFPNLGSPPPSPWRARAEALGRRPRLRHVASLAVMAIFVCSLLFFARHRNGAVYTQIPAFMREAPHISPPPNALFHGQPYTSSLHRPPPQALDTHSLNTPVASLSPSDPVVFSLIMFSEDSANEGAVLMKSILMYTSRPVEFHIICDHGARLYLEKRLALITRPRHNIFVRFYILSLLKMIARIEREGAIVSDHSAGTPGLMKLFIHEILPDSVTRAIFVDTDAFFISDPAMLWDYFDRLKPTTAISMPTHPDQNSEEWHHANRICSCIMLLDLARLRLHHLMDSNLYNLDPSPVRPQPLGPPAFQAMFGKPQEGAKYEGVKLGDQGYWWAIVSYYPELFEHLSFEWEFSSCLMDMYNSGLGEDDKPEHDEKVTQVHTLDTPHNGEVVLPKMLHFNCLDGTPHYYEWEGWSDQTNSLTRRWWPAVQYHAGFKWLWLNAHHPTGALKMETVEEVVFADERVAEERASGLALAEP